MLYDYYCGECNHTMADVYQSIKDSALTRCPSCGKDSLERVIYGGLASFCKNTTTIGQLGDDNWKKMGHYKRSEIETKAKEDSKAAESPFQNFGPASKKDIMKMTPQQKKRYIMEGKK